MWEATSFTSGNHKRSPFRLTKLSIAAGQYENAQFFYKFISLMPDDSLEREQWK